MLAYRFLEEGTRCVAYTPDAGGRRLPVRGSVWLFAGPVDLDPQRAPQAPASQPSGPQVKAGFLRKGYCLWPDDAERSEPCSSKARPPLP